MSLTGNPDTWYRFEQWIETQIEKKHKRLENLNDPMEMYRTQGEIRNLKDMLNLKGNPDAAF